MCSLCQNKCQYFLFISEEGLMYSNWSGSILMNRKYFLTWWAVEFKNEKVFFLNSI